MATVIDSLVVELGMDTRKFEEGERTALVTVEEFKRRLATVGEAAQGGAEKLSNLFMVLRGGIFGFVAALGLGAMATFVERVMQMDAQTSRLARSLGMSTRELSVWQGVLKQVGGTAENANSFFTSLAESLASIRLGITMPSGPFAFVMGQMGLNMRTATAEQVAQRMPPFVQEQLAQGRRPEDIRVLLKSIGADEAMINAAFRGDFAKMRRAVESGPAGPITKEQGEAAENLAAKQSLVERTFDRLGSISLPALEGAVNKLTAAFTASLDAFRGMTGGRAPASTASPVGRRGGLGLGDPLGVLLGTPHTDHIEHDRAWGIEELRSGHGERLRGDHTMGVRGFRSRFPIPDKQSSLGGRGGTTVNVAAINIMAPYADPRKVAAMVPPELRRVQMVGNYDSSLTG